MSQDARSQPSNYRHLQVQAWIVCNAAHHAPDAEVYRDVAAELYRQATHEQIEQLYARLDAQNAELDTLIERATPAAQHNQSSAGRSADPSQGRTSFPIRRNASFRTEVH